VVVLTAGRLTLEKALHRLPPEFREVLVLFELESWSYQAIAAALEVPIETVMTRLTKARRRLQAELSRSGLSRLGDG
jgi:RNA polymerase sigma-70 factor, ECF subfamily